MTRDTTRGGGQTAASAFPLRYGIRLVSVGSSGPEIEPPEWLVFYDPDGGDENVGYPTGVIESSEDPSLAITFSSFVEAAEYYRQQSKRTPMRPDGAPNRPLAAFTVEIVQVPT